MKGHRIFGAMSILMVLGGAAGMIGGVIAILGAGVLAALLGDAASFGLLMLSSIVMWASGAAGLIAGITGTRKAEEPGSTTACMVFGLLAMALAVLGNILSIVGGSGFYMWSLMTGLLLPVLHLIGALKSRINAHVTGGRTVNKEWRK